MIQNFYTTPPLIDLAELEHARSYWNARAPGYDEEFSTAPIRHWSIERLVEQLAPQPGERIADIGTGTARVFTEFPRNFKVAEQLVGVDIAENMLEIARLRCAAFGLHRFKAKLGLFTDLPLETDSMDGVVSSMSLHHITDAQKIEAIAEMRRVLKPSGRVVIVDLVNALPNPGDDFALRLEMVRTFHPLLPEREALGRCQHILEYASTPAFLISQFAAAGFYVTFESFTPIVGIITARKLE
jgi:ubiquinone/menaquinone biosynthesis C-methylase UbiE